MNAVLCPLVVLPWESTPARWQHRWALLCGTQPTITPDGEVYDIDPVAVVHLPHPAGAPDGLDDMLAALEETSGCDPDLRGTLDDGDGGQLIVLVRRGELLDDLTEGVRR